MSEPATAARGQTLRTRYQLRERIGAGGQGEIWRAFDPKSGVDVALKILQPGPGRSAAAWVALVHEYESTNKLDHPGILKMFAPERDGTTFLLPMELATGGDARRLRGAGYLTVVPVLIEVARALQHAHERGVIHRDLKPGNILFDERGRVKVADFGISGNQLDPGTDAMVRGLSPFTASPEQLRGEPPTPADDIYGLGALAYELLSKKPPHFPHFDAQRVQTEPVPPLVPAQQIPPQLARLIAQLLAKDPRQRPASMRDVVDDLEASLNDTLSFDDTMTFDFNTEEAHPEADAPPAAAVAELPAQVLPEGTAAANEPIAAPPPRLSAHELDGAALFEELGPVRLPNPARIEPMRGGGLRVLIALALLASAAAAAWLWQPQWVPRLEGMLGLSETARPAPRLATVTDAQAQARWQSEHILLEQRLGALAARGAERWGGTDFSAARARAAESVGAHDAGSLSLAQQRLTQATELAARVSAAAPAALESQLAMGEGALASGQAAEAREAFDLALQIDPENGRARAGAAHAHELLNAARGAPAAPPSAAPAAVPSAPTPATRPGVTLDERYAKAAGEGYAALGAGRLEQSRAAFERARALRPQGPEAAEGLRRVKAALRARGFGSQRARASDLEGDERWDEALAVYDAVLQIDPSQGFAQEGRVRARDRMELGDGLQAIIERPDRLAVPDARTQAATLLQRAQQVTAPGPVLRLQMARVAALLPEFERPVHLSLLSDNFTVVSVPGIGNLGSFTRHEVELRPGRYEVIGTRDGYHEVHREVTLTPAQPQTLTISCSQPL